VYNFNEYKEELLLESLINETYLYFSDDFENILRGIDSPIAVDILSNFDKDIKPDMTFLDTDGDNYGFITFISGSNASKIYAKEFGFDDDKFLNTKSVRYIKDFVGSDSGFDEFDMDFDILINSKDKKTSVYNKSRNTIKIGKFAKKLLGNKYKDSEIEDFVNKFKAKQSNSYEFRLVDGEEIVTWYDSKNYKSQDGQLGSSCMKNSDSKIFEMYVKNPEVCKMLILLEDDELIGRALVWKIDEINGDVLDKPTYFMDRQYTIEDSYVHKFREYAKEKGWMYKTYNKHDHLKNVTLNGSDSKIDMKVKLKKLNYDKYPYLDTFRLYDPKLHTLYNSDGEYETGNYFSLDSTDGGYSSISDVWSDWHGEYICEDDAIYSIQLSTYILSVDAIYIRSRRDYLPRTHPDLVEDEWTHESLHSDDAVFSDEYSGYINSENAILVITKIESKLDLESSYIHKDDNFLEINKDTIWYKRLIRYSPTGIELILPEILEEDFNSIDTPSDLLIFANKVKGEDLLLTSLDALVLEKELESERMLINIFEYIDGIYNKGLEDELIKGIKEIRIKLDKLKNDKNESILLKSGKIDAMINLIKGRLKVLKETDDNKELNLINLNFDFGNNDYRMGLLKKVNEL
jgi:hypothetical protein